MKLAVLGPGAIGSTFAFQLAKAGHDVTVVARGRRLETLERDQAIVRTDGQRASVRVLGALDVETPYDLVLVTVLVSQVDVVLPALTASAAKHVMFVFNTFEPLDRLRDAVGAARFSFGFPAILASIDDAKLTSDIQRRGMQTTVTDAAWARLFTEAGIPSVTTHDMESWLRTHAAMVVPVMIVAVSAHARGAGVSWAEATKLALAMREGFALVRRLGNAIEPGAMRPIARLPTFAIALLLWALSRSATIRKTGAAGPGEPRALIDAMTAAAKGETPMLAAVRP